MQTAHKSPLNVLTFDSAPLLLMREHNAESCVVIATLTSGSDALLDVTEDRFILPCVITGESAPGGGIDCVWLGLGERGELSLGMGEDEGVGPGEGRGERVPISTARSSVQARPWLWR